MPLGVVVLPFAPSTDVPFAVVLSAVVPFAVVLSAPPATPVVDETVRAVVLLALVALAVGFPPATPVVEVTARAEPLADIGMGPLGPFPGRGVGCTGSGDAEVVWAGVPSAFIGMGPLAPLPGRGVGCTGSGGCSIAVVWAGPFNANMRLASIAARKFVFIGRIFIFFGKDEAGLPVGSFIGCLANHTGITKTHLSTFIQASTVPMSFMDNLPVFREFWALRQNSGGRRFKIMH